jgi:hypothetical protein
MNIGTKTVLYGAHCFPIHWLFVAYAWLELYGFRRVLVGFRRVRFTTRLNSGARLRRYRQVPEYASLGRPALWVAFLIHDLGYLGQPNLDGPEGERHPELGARIMRTLFGEPWGGFVLYHSRFLAKQHGQRPSALCIADKLAIARSPAWLYLPLVRLTGEIDEYMAKSAHMNNTGGKYAGMNISLENQRDWHRDMCAYVTRWVETHKDGREDTWTPRTKEAVTASGVWQ